MMRAFPKTLGLLVIMLVAALALSACGDDGDGKPTPTPTSTPVTDGGWYWKPDGFIDYAPSGMPDFDQKQDGWYLGAAAPTWTHCGPVAVANSFWWFDSKFEPSPVPPPTINDNYRLVEAYGGWDDHNASNVIPFVDDLAAYMNTDIGHTGTMVEDMHAGIGKYLIDKGLEKDYTNVMVKSPEFYWIVDEVERCEDVVLLLGFWQWQGGAVGAADGEWVRIGGHYVTTAGVNEETSQIGISDPYWDNAEAGGPGRVPVAHAYPHAASVHNDAQYVSHDIYDVVASDSPGGKWALEGYADGKDVANFEDQNWAQDLLSYRGVYAPDLPVHVEIDYAVAVSPVEVKPTPTPTPSPTCPPTPTPPPTPTRPPQTPPTATPEVTPPITEPTPSPGPTQQPEITPMPTPVPDPTAPVITGIHTRHHTNPTNGRLVIEVHCIPAYFPDGTDIYDLHFFADGEHLKSVYFDQPLAPCEWVSVEVDATSAEFVTIYLTDADHNIWGQTGFWLYNAAVGTVISPVGQQSPAAPVIPVVEVWNAGHVCPIGFPVVCQIYAVGYELVYEEISTEIVEMELAAGESALVEFPAWVPMDPGTYLIVFYTDLIGDEWPADDWVESFFDV